MRSRYRITVFAAALVAGWSLMAMSVVGQGQQQPQPQAPGTTAPMPKVEVVRQPLPAGWQSYKPRRTADGQPDVQGIWLAQGIGTEMGVGGPFEANSSAALIAARLKEVAESGGTLNVGRCGNFFWDPKPDLDIPRGPQGDGPVPLLTPWAAARKLEINTHQKDRNPPDRTRFFDMVPPESMCMSGTPYPIFNPLPYSANQFFQGPGWVMFTQEYSHQYRFVPLDGRPHLTSKIGLYMGDSRGRWEGNTLIVEATNFNGKGRFDGDPGAAIVQSDAARVVERFTIASADIILYEAEVIDPKVTTQPWKMNGAFTRAPKDYEIFEHACHEGNSPLWLAYGIAPPWFQ